ncbi:MAG: DUF6206 family protein [Bacillota bacterium]
MGLLKTDSQLLKDFERELDPRWPERSGIPARVLGYGEISTVFELQDAKGLALKRMPIFESQKELDEYRALYSRYNSLLINDVGIPVPGYGSEHFTDDYGRIIFYIIQDKLPQDSIGSRLIHILPPEEVNRLFLLVLRELKKLVHFNRKNRGSLEIAVDGQISNWALEGFDPADPRPVDSYRVLYIDTSTPMIKINGDEQLDPELFLRSAPCFLVWIIRKLFLKDIMSRYYDIRLVTVDLIANFFKEQLPGLIPGLINTANQFFAGEGRGLVLSPITYREVKAYYREDALIWRLYLTFRKADRLLHRFMGKRYVYILPEKVKR